jgi:hypothetical protein
MDNVVSKLIESIERAYAKLAENGYDTGKEMITVSHDSIWARVSTIEEMEKQLEESQKSYESACDVSSDYYHEIRELEAAAPKWISVKERLPGMKTVIAVNANGEMLIGLVNPASYGTLYKCDSRDDVIFDVTHWMPLPEPPKEET